MSMSESRVASTPQQGMPNMGVPLVNMDRTVAFAWYRLLISLYNAVLAGATMPISVVGLSQQIKDLQNQLTAMQAQIDALTIVGFSAGADVPPHTTGFMQVTLGGTPFRIPLYVP